jgi:hypothetical protein
VRSPTSGAEPIRADLKARELDLYHKSALSCVRQNQLLAFQPVVCPRAIKVLIVGSVEDYDLIA